MNEKSNTAGLPSDHAGLVERLRAESVLPVCPFDKRSPDYWTTPNDKPCKVCGGEPEGPDKCTGADLRIMKEAAEAIAALSRAPEAVATVIWYDPQLDPFPPRGPHKIIDASIAFMDEAPLGTKLYAIPPKEEPQ